MPTGQFSQSVPSSCFATEVAASSKYLPGGQFVHAAWPVDAAYLPEPHVLHDESPGEDAYVPGAQSSQVEMEAAPTAVENVPTPQFSQVASFVAPVLVLYFPAAHE
jgi:hypothetical protein